MEVRCARPGEDIVQYTAQYEISLYFSPRERASESWLPLTPLVTPILLCAPFPTPLPYFSPSPGLREWAFLIPAWTLVLMLCTYAGYLALNIYDTPDLDNLRTVTGTFWLLEIDLTRPKRRTFNHSLSSISSYLDSHLALAQTCTPTYSKWTQPRTRLQRSGTPRETSTDDTTTTMLTTPTATRQAHTHSPDFTYPKPAGRMVP